MMTGFDGIERIRLLVGDTVVAKWEHLQMFKELEQRREPDDRKAPKLTKDHINPQYGKKMRVSYAAQTLSKSVSIGLQSCMNKPEMARVMGLISYCSFMDKLFDSVNGLHIKPIGAKVYRTQVTAGSPHFDFWHEAGRTINSLVLDAADPKMRKVTHPNKSGWVRTLLGMEYVCKILFSLGIKSFAPKRLNQDPLENLFGVLRSLCGGNCNPNAAQFEGALKTAIANDVALHEAKAMNCQNGNSSFLCNLKTPLGVSDSALEGHNDEPTNGTEDGAYDRLHDEIRERYRREKEAIGRKFVRGVNNLSSASFASVIADRILQHQSCDQCKSLLFSKSDSVYNNRPNCEMCDYRDTFLEELHNQKVSADDVKGIERRNEMHAIYEKHLKDKHEEEEDTVCIPPAMVLTVSDFARNIFVFLDQYGHFIDLKAKISGFVCFNVDFDWLVGCETHRMTNVEAILGAPIALWLPQWLKKENQRIKSIKAARRLANKEKRRI